MTAPLHRELGGVRFASTLLAHRGRPALVTADGSVDYGDLAGRVAAAAAVLGPTRRLVLLVLRPDVESVAVYLACLSAGHPVLLASPDRAAQLTAAYDPDVVVDGELQVRREGSHHDLHPDLALLLSTSGSTGSPKLVRLSRDNVQSNADAIAQALSIRPDDRAITSLPLHYCYGLSVLHSHLATGAATVLTDLSVVDPCFWDLFRQAGATTLAGVPHTFVLLERVGFAEMDLPRLRYVTQAGGRLAPERVTALSELGQRRGWDLVVMYGQTEATARMALLDPDLASTRPAAIGRPIPGGSFRLEGDELVYSGRNVMLGYAQGPADLARGRDVTELRTGDLARVDEAGVYEIVGRRSSFVKVFGLRIDVDRVTSTLTSEGFDAACVGDDDELVVAVAGDVDTEQLRRHAAALSGLPASVVRVCSVAALPRTSSGKVDLVAVRALTGRRQRERSRPSCVRSVLADVLERADVGPDDSFVSLGGDSLSYVEASLRLEELLGTLPDGWHLQSVAELSAAPAPQAGRGRALETGVLLRAIAILLVVAHHTQLFKVLGGAHVLLAVAGFNFARFQLTAAVRPQRIRRIGRATARVVVPTVVVVLLGMVLLERYDWRHLLLVHDLVAPGLDYKHFWFVEVLVQLMLVATALLALPTLDALERRHPFATPVALLGLAMLPRFDVVPAFDGRARLYAPYAVAWLFLWGWAAARARTTGHRLLLTMVLAGALPGFFFGNHVRTAVVGAGLLLLLWLPRVRVPRAVVPAVGVLASASLYVYLAHFLVLPTFHSHPLPAYAASLAAGLAYWQLATRAEDALVRRLARGRGRARVRGEQRSH